VGFELMLPCHIFFLVAFLEEIFITNIIFIRYINYIIIIFINNNVLINEKTI